MRFINKIAAVMDKLGEYWSYIAISMVLLPTFEAIVLRLVFNTTTLWNRELTIIIFGIFFTIGYAYAESSNSHVQMDIIYSHYPPLLKMVVDTLIVIICSIYCYILASNACDIFVASWNVQQRSESLWAPVVWPSRLAIIIGTVLLWIRSCITYVNRISESLGKINAKQANGGGCE